MNSRPKLGVVSNLTKLSDKHYVSELMRNGGLKEWESVTRSAQAGAEDIVELFRLSTMVVLTGSNINVLEEVNGELVVNWEDPFVRRGLAAFLNMLMLSAHTEEKFFEKHAVFNCFSAQLLTLALTVWEHINDKQIWIDLSDPSRLEAVDSPLADIVLSEGFRAPLAVLPEMELGMRETNNGRAVMALHRQIMLRDSEHFFDEVELREGQDHEFIEQARFGNWHLSQGHDDYTAVMAKTMKPQFDDTGFTGNYRLIKSINPHTHDLPTTRERGVDSSASRGAGTLEGALQGMAA